MGFNPMSKTELAEAGKASAVTRVKTILTKKVVAEPRKSALTISAPKTELAEPPEIASVDTPTL